MCVLFGGHKKKRKHTKVLYFSQYKKNVNLQKTKQKHTHTQKKEEKQELQDLLGTYGDDIETRKQKNENFEENIKKYEKEFENKFGNNYNNQSNVEKYGFELKNQFQANIALIKQNLMQNIELITNNNNHKHNEREGLFILYFAGFFFV